jgi:hypothetical protein
MHSTQGEGLHDILLRLHLGGGTTMAAACPVQVYITLV